MKELHREYTVALRELQCEIERAKGKHTNSDNLLDALAKQLGKLANDPSPGGPARLVCLQVATVAMRLYVEGTSNDITPVLGLFDAAGLVAERELANASI